MPKGGKKSEKKSNRDIIASDVKLSDFADCSARTSRLRKSAGSTLHEEVQDVRSSEVLWYDRDLDEFELPSTSSDTRKKNKAKIIPENLADRPGVQYPIDIWFLIGKYIKPEDVKTFATICKGSYNVSRTYSFWMEMYKRHYKQDAKLPQRLQPECIEGSLCLKVYVIRALYHMYPHFTTQLTHRPQADVYSLSNLCCTSMWRVQQNGKWLFHFKFQAPTESPVAPMNYRLAIQNMWTRQEDDEKTNDTYINHNPDEGCKILRISCSHFVIVSPFIMGSRLSDVRINLAHDMRRQKLQLIFCYSNYCRANKSSSSSKENGVYGDVVEFDPVENISVLNWWHPQYPSGYKV